MAHLHILVVLAEQASGEREIPHYGENALCRLRVAQRCSSGPAGERPRR